LCCGRLIFMARGGGKSKKGKSGGAGAGPLLRRGPCHAPFLLRKLREIEASHECDRPCQHTERFDPLAATRERHLERSVPACNTEASQEWISNRVMTCSPPAQCHRHTLRFWTRGSSLKQTRQQANCQQLNYFF
jgi:hypothetical protein